MSAIYVAKRRPPRAESLCSRGPHDAADRRVEEHGHATGAPDRADDPLGVLKALLARADQLAGGDSSEQQRALHLVDFVIFGGGEHAAEAHRRKADLLDARASSERSFVAHNVLKSAAVLERDKSGAAAATEG
jgi:hypothetical protein